MHELIARLTPMQGISVRQMASAWLVSIDKPFMRFDVTIPATVLEWFISACNGQQELIWQDWVDYCGYTAGEDVRALEVRMRTDIERFVEHALAAEDFSVMESGTPQWRHCGKWTDIWATR